nr:EAL domain-containing protein [Planosporangium flavigriseum]
MIATDLAGRVLYWNAAAEKLYGYESSQAVGRVLADLIAPADHRDVTQVRHFAVIVENSDDAIVETDPDGVIRAVNPAARDVFGYEPGELIGRHVDLLVPAEESALLGAVRAAVLAGESPEVFVTKAVHKDGSLVNVAVRLSPVFEAGAVVGVSGLSRDLTADIRAKADLAASDRKFRDHFERVGAPQTEVSLSGYVTSVNDAVCALLGRPRHEVEGAPLCAFYHPSDQGAGNERLAALLRGDADAGSWERILAAGDGSAVPVLVQAAVVKDADGTPYGIAAFLHDLRELRAAEQALRVSEARYRAIAETAQEGIWTMDRSGRTLYANDKLAAILGVPIDEIYRRPVTELVGAANVAPVIANLNSRTERGTEEYELSYPHPDGGTRVLRISASPLRDDTGQSGSLAMIADVTSARRAERELQQRALRDELTGLANRALLNDRLERAISRGARVSSPVTVIMVDLDQFKLINDTWGHEAGDQLLVHVGQRLISAVRPEDTVARFGGDGFVIVCEDTDEERAHEVADRIMAGFSEPFDLDGQRLHARISVGIAICPPHSAPDLVRFAEAAMYDAKARGRNRVQVFNAALAEESADRLSLSNDLRDALARDELVLYYQPVVNLRTGEVLGAEALARWHHPTRGPVSPAKFVAVAEATGLAPALDRWALDRVRRDAATLRRALPSLHINVNISATHLSDPSLEETVLSVFRTGDLSVDELMLEVTESAMMANLEQARAVLERLKAHGIQSAIDDFGTGYSSLGYLSRLPASKLKIDRSFIEHITEDADALAITSSVVRLASRLRMITVAEGVETPEQLAVLRDLGCTGAQGYLFSPAVAPARLADVVKRLTGTDRSTDVAS